MKFLHANPPRFSVDQLAGLAEQHYGLRGHLKPLYSERDQNFYLQQADGGVVLKVANKVEDPAIIDCQIKLLQHLAMVDKTLPVPRVINTRDGAPTITITDSTGAEHIFYILSYLSGTLAAGVNLSPDIGQAIGSMVARLGRAMRGFFHPATHGRDLLWDVRVAKNYLPIADELQDKKLTDMAKRQIEEFCAGPLARLAELRTQVIHGDVHEHNLILSEGGDAIRGIIDFGDVIHAPLLLDIADSISDFLNKPERITQLMRPLLAGYHHITPLEAEEVDLLYDVVVMRMMIGLVVNNWRALQTPDEPNYLHAATGGIGQTMNMLLSAGRDKITRDFRLVAGIPLKTFMKQSHPDSKQAVGKVAGLEGSEGLEGLEGSGGLDRLIERRRRFMGSHLYVFYNPPLHIVRGSGVWLYDAAGKRYMDCYNNVPIVGHCHPYVTEAIARQARILNTNTRYLSEAVLDYAERITEKTGGELRVCAFVNSGSEANDIAWRMATVWSGQQGALCQEFGYHGITTMIDAVSPSASKTGKLAPHVRTIAAPDLYRGAHASAPNAAQLYGADADRAIASLAAAGLKPAAYFLDSAFITNGLLSPLKGYVADVFARVRAAGGLCIGDEVQSGFGRMGDHFWGYQHHGVMPDIVTIGKPAGNGHPLGLVITRPEIYEKFISTTAFFSTFGGNNVSCAAGLAVLDIIENEDLVAHAGIIGKYLKQKLGGLMARYEVIGDVRVTGLAIGIEIVADRAAKTPDKQATDRLINLLRDEGVLVASEGEHGSVIKIRPPLIFQTEHVDFFIEAFTRALALL